MLRDVVAAGLLLPAPAIAHAQTLEDEAVAWLTRYLQVDTINPPGNESLAVDFIGSILDAEGIAWQSAESAPGRGNFWARLERAATSPP